VPPHRATNLGSNPMRIVTIISAWCLAVATACASNPAARRAVLIADADRTAKEAVAAEKNLDVAKIPARSLAVLPFTVSEHDTLLTPLGFGLADLLSTDLAVSQRLILVDRLRIGAELRELTLVEEGVTDPRGGPRVGRLIGARQLLTGSITAGPAGAVRLQARMIDVLGGTVEDLVTAEVPVSRIIDAEKSLALVLFERLGVTLTPAQRVAVQQQQTTQLAALVAFGRGAEADARGDAIGATAAFTEAARLDVSFTAARAHAASPSTVAGRASGVQRVLSMTSQALNQPAGAQVSEAGDAALSASLSVPVVITVRVVP
jgi:TolB-like protein